MRYILRHGVASEPLLVIEEISAYLLQVGGRSEEPRPRPHGHDGRTHGEGECVEVEGRAEWEAVQHHIGLSQHLKEPVVAQQRGQQADTVIQVPASDRTSRVGQNRRRRKEEEGEVDVLGPQSPHEFSGPGNLVLVVGGVCEVAGGEDQHEVKSGHGAHYLEEHLVHESVQLARMDWQQSHRLAVEEHLQKGEKGSVQRTLLARAPSTWPSISNGAKAFMALPVGGAEDSSSAAARATLSTTARVKIGQCTDTTCTSGKVSIHEGRRDRFPTRAIPGGGGVSTPVRRVRVSE